MSPDGVWCISLPTRPVCELVAKNNVHELMLAVVVCQCPVEFDFLEIDSITVLFAESLQFHGSRWAGQDFSCILALFHGTDNARVIGRKIGQYSILERFGLELRDLLIQCGFLCLCFGLFGRCGCFHPFKVACEHGSLLLKLALLRVRFLLFGICCRLLCRLSLVLQLRLTHSKDEDDNSYDRYCPPGNRG